MESKPVIYLVAPQSPGREGKYDRWYEEVHLPLLFKFKGLEGATRYRAINETDEYPRNLNIYTFESLDVFKAYLASPERAAAMEEKSQTWGQAGPDVKWRVPYQFVKTWKRQP